MNSVAVETWQGQTWGRGGSTTQRGGFPLSDLKNGGKIRLDFKKQSCVTSSGTRGRKGRVGEMNERRKKKGLFSFQPVDRQKADAV